MRTPYFIALLTTALVTNFSYAQDIGNLADALDAMPGYRAKVEYAITLPQSESDIIYTVEIQQPDTTDSYLIDWNVMSPSGPLDGFTAWFDGHFYNYRNHRLQEHHEAWDAQTPPGAKAVQNSAMFTSLLPRFIAAQLREIMAGGYTYTVKQSSEEIRVDAVRQLAGEPDAELSWTFHGCSLAPLEFYADYNPGAVTGQQVKAVYMVSDSITHPLDEAFLRGRYPDAFSRYRESQFAIENMRGEYLPAFSLPQITGGRLERQATEGFDYPTVVALLDPENPLAGDFVNAIRTSFKHLPFNANIIWACSHKNPAVSAELLGTLPGEEAAVVGAGSLASDCGAAALPVVLVCNKDGKISNLIVGMNNTLQTDVLQMLIQAAT